MKYPLRGATTKTVGIVTDTTACVPPEQVKTLNIEVVPVPLIINEKTYRDGIDITPTEFYTMLRNSKKLPTTSASSPTPYLEAFRKASRRAQSILCLTEPVKFSAMYNSARAAVEMAKNTLHDVTIEVMECTTAAAGQGLVALAAARAAALDESLEEVKRIVGNVMSRVNLFATLDTLHYLARSGRVPQAAALVNTILDLKPVFTLNHADPHTVGLPRTTKSALGRILKLMDATVKKGQQLHVAVMHADAEKEAIILKDRITAQFDCKEIYITEFTPVMGVHTGPGLVGAAFYGE
ncbi:MAG: DegV family protein [Dehalococcoidales bacterium]|nr:DegV family protein [Dehalococcoidales bacterium]